MSSEAGGGSVTTKNTLLAGGASTTNVTANSKKVFKIEGSDMRMDEKLFNPDALWKREQAG